MRRGTLIVLACAVVAAGGLYLLKGRPLLAEQPYAEREAEIAQRDASELNPSEMLARLQLAARQQPDSPEPQYFIGVLMRAQGRNEDALRAFQSALRRDDTHVPSLVALADVIMMRDGGIVTAPAAQLYARAWRLDESQHRAGLLSALPAYEAGDVDAAEEHWAEVKQDMAPNDPLFGMLEAFKSRIDEERAAEETPAE
ncbi:hypothetical protein [Henriciella sp.]|uniref:tetratricopeptide repeat protein n=1 Tax=Henriciella sp. TaxID=1968823 RepID=UPI0026119B15|nr:hypothetical protein [Henriciella sp.]